MRFRVLIRKAPAVTRDDPSVDSPPAKNTTPLPEQVGAASSLPPLLGIKLAGLAALGVAALIYHKMAMPASFLALVGLIATPRLTGRARWAARAWLTIAVLGSGAGLVRFVLVEAIPGVIAGGRMAAGRQALSTLRTIVAAQDRARAQGLLDPDADGIGSALTLQELAGLAPLPGGQRLQNPLLALRQDAFTDSAVGPALRQAGYLFSLCLPAQGDSFAVEPGEQRDHERAERRYLTYAWPELGGTGAPREAYFADEHERILVFENTPPENLSKNTEQRQKTTANSADAPRYLGTLRPPTCEAALNDPGWTPWKDKQPRAKLPGDQ